MKKRNNPKVERIDTDFAKEMRKVAAIRVGKGLAQLKKEDISLREMTSLLRRTDGYKQSLEELKTKPKKLEF